MWNQRPCFRFEIDNFSKKETVISSHTFVSGGYEWFLNVYPKGEHCDGHMSVFLCASNPKSLTGWKRTAKYYFLVLKPSDKELHRSSIASDMFWAKYPSWGFRKTMPLSKLEEIGGLEKDKLIIEVYINIIEVVDGEVKDVVDNKETHEDISDSQACATHAALLLKIFADDPELVIKDFKPMNQEVMTKYTKLLSVLSDILGKGPDNLSETEQEKAYKEMKELFNIQLDWLKSNLEELKPSNSDGSLVQEEESLSRKKARAEVLKLEELVKKIGVVEPQLDEALPYDAGTSEEEGIKNLEKMVSSLKVEHDMDKEEKAESFDEGFFLVNEVD